MNYWNVDAEHLAVGNFFEKQSNKPTYEKDVVLEAYKKYGTICEAAKSLNMSHKKFKYHLRFYNIPINARGGKK